MLHVVRDRASVLAEPERRRAMRMRWVLLGLATLALTGSALGAVSFTERVEARRMTVLEVDRDAGAFLCAEHRRWIPVLRTDLKGVEPGDAVRVEQKDGHPTRLMALRTASDGLKTASDGLAGVDR
jgi:hypothetical protein